MAKVDQIPRRFISSVSHDDAELLTNTLLQDESLGDLLQRFWKGDHMDLDDARDFLFRLQCLMEATEQRVFNPQHEAEGLDSKEGA